MCVYPTYTYGTKSLHVTVPATLETVTFRLYRFYTCIYLPGTGWNTNQSPHFCSAYPIKMLKEGCISSPVCPCIRPTNKLNIYRVKTWEILLFNSIINIGCRCSIYTVNVCSFYGYVYTYVHTDTHTDAIHRDCWLFVVFLLALQFVRVTHLKQLRIRSFLIFIKYLRFYGLFERRENGSCVAHGSGTGVSNLILAFAHTFGKYLFKFCALVATEQKVEQGK